MDQEAEIGRHHLYWTDCRSLTLVDSQQIILHGEAAADRQSKKICRDMSCLLLQLIP